MTEGELRALLESLGGCPADVAATLRAGGVLGLPRVPHACPVANLVGARTGLRCEVRQSSCFLYPLEGDRMQVDCLVCAFLPRAVRDFYHRFDRGDFPELIQQENPS
jgi:hypothetical protein